MRSCARVRRRRNKLLPDELGTVARGCDHVPCFKAKTIQRILSFTRADEGQPHQHVGRTVLKTLNLRRKGGKSEREERYLLYEGTSRPSH